MCVQYLGPRPRHTNRIRPLRHTACGMKSFEPVVARLLTPNHCQHSPPQNTHTRSNCLVRIVFKIFSQINLLFTEGVRRRGKNNMKQMEWFRALKKNNSACIPWEKNRPISPELAQLCCSYHHSTLSRLVWCVQTCRVCNICTHQQIQSRIYKRHGEDTYCSIPNSQHTTLLGLGCVAGEKALADPAQETAQWQQICYNYVERSGKNNDINATTSETSRNKSICMIRQVKYWTVIYSKFKRTFKWRDVWNIQNLTICKIATVSWLQLQPS